MTVKKTSKCMLCGRPSPKQICDGCSETVRGEALHKRKKDQKHK
ncbi:MAG TPA: hypothetical protein VNL38_03230 [Candidatus Nitrosotenuis sp.]|nr:hypothetical protein [Candidatus Nitrosotenuis sp.]